MRETESTTSVEAEEDDQIQAEGTSTETDSDDYVDEPAFDWTVFLFRASAFLVLGATLVTAFDLSLNQDVEWLTVMRLSILPFVGGALVLAAGELLDRRGD